MLNQDEVRVTRITLYPVKSLDGIDVAQAEIMPTGALAKDRRWAMIDGQGNFVNAKRTPRIHEHSAQFDLAHDQVTVGIRGQSAVGSYSLIHQAPELSQWLSDFFGGEIRLIGDSEVGHPDDLVAPGPTILSTASLQGIASWFDWPIEQTRRRFRANIEISAPNAFWEDRLFGPLNQPVRFRIGAIVLEGSNPCARCAVPSRDPDTGAVTAKFAADFAKRREESLPSWAERSRFDHFYRLAVNTRPTSPGGLIAVGDVVEIF